MMTSGTGGEKPCECTLCCWTMRNAFHWPIEIGKLSQKWREAVRMHVLLPYCCICTTSRWRIGDSIFDTGDSIFDMKDSKFDTGYSIFDIGDSIFA